MNIPINFFNKNNTTINLLIILGILFLFFMIYKGCKNDNIEYNSYQLKLEEAKNIIKENKEKIKSYEIEIDSLKNKEKITYSRLDSSLEKIETYDRQLIFSKKKIDDLANKIKNYPITQTPTDKEKDCDSLVLEIEKREISLENIINEYSETVQQYDYMISLKDSIIFKQEIVIKNLKTTVDYIQDNVLDLPKDVKRRNQVFVGGDLYGNPVKIFSGYGGNISLLNKKGQIYEIKVATIENKAYYGAGLKFRLSFKK